ncbi:MAG: FkbM family methyltransferase [Thermodesulfobacteriota bacterium]|nr:FkbM family methyltransferase [Thermodesulfobacteriota bacterium]
MIEKTSKTGILAQLRGAGLWHEGQPLRIHLGCGGKHFDRYINIDYPPSGRSMVAVKADIFADIRSLDFPCESVDEVRLHHVFEHFGRVVALAMLIKWHGWLKIGGKLYIETPDLIGSAKTLISNASWKTKIGAVRHLTGDQAASWAYHVDQWFPERFKRTLGNFGFDPVKTRSWSWQHEPYLSNVEAIAIKNRKVPIKEQLHCAEELLWESTVAAAEKPLLETWMKQLYAALSGEFASELDHIQKPGISCKELPNGSVLMRQEMGDSKTKVDQHSTIMDGAIEDCIGDEDLVFDVGANIGSKTEIYLARGARVVCFEPQPECVSALREKYQDNHSVTVVDKGLGDRCGQMPLYICSNANTISTFSDEWKTGRFSGHSWDKTITVDVTTLDKAIEIYGRPMYCKIDVEGYEFDVLKGLSQPIPCLSFEFTKEFLENARKCVAHLEILGYKHFNLILEENTKHVFEKWVSSKILFRLLEDSDNSLLWGDVYAKII